MKYVLETVLKLVLALVLGGFIGYEREFKSRPAGLRTHMLVCIGAALVQITSINFIARTQGQGYITDPMRLGAQVISGIGFLGAGTIFKEGATIRGLTTAATIWTIACVGLAVGSGLYWESTLATLLLYISLKSFVKLEDYLDSRKKYARIEVIAENIPGMLGLIAGAMGKLEIQIVDIEMERGEEVLVKIVLSTKMPYAVSMEMLIDRIMGVGGIKSVKFL